MTTFIRTAAAAALLSSLALPAQAIEFEALGTRFSLINDLSLGAAIRVEDQDPNLIGIANQTADGQSGRLFSTNSDDGNLAFDNGDLIAAALKLSSELSASWGPVGIFVRGSYLFDPVLDDLDYFDPADYVGGPTRTPTPADLQRKRDAVSGRVGNDADLLDAYLFGGFDVGSRYLGWRLGRQVLNWGESTLVQNGLNTLVSADASQLRVPGFQLEEVFVPVGMAVFNINLTDNTALEAFYQFEWRPSQPDPVGTFFSSNDFVAHGGNLAEIGFGRCPEFSAPGVCAAAPGGSSVPRGPDRDAADGGQGGIAISSYLENLGGTEIAFYAANIHSRLPLISGNATPAGFEGVAGSAQYFIEYPEDIKLYGVSFNASLPFGGLALQGEYSLKQDQPLQIDEVETLLAGQRLPLPSQLGPFNPGEYIQAWRRFDVSQVDLSVSRIAGPMAWNGADQGLFLLEAAATMVHDLPSLDELRFEGPNTVRPGDPLVATVVGVPVQDGGYAESFSWGYRALARFTYNNVFNAINVEPTLVFAHDVNGTSPTPILNFIEHRRELRALVDVTYQQNWQFRLAYTNFFGGREFNALSDRDNVSLAVSYSF